MIVAEATVAKAKVAMARNRDRRRDRRPRERRKPRENASHHAIYQPHLPRRKALPECEACGNRPGGKRSALSPGALPGSGDLAGSAGTGDLYRQKRRGAALEKNGYVRRESDPDDKRVLRVYPTEKATALQPAIGVTLADWNELITRGFSEEEKETLETLMIRVMENAMAWADGENR